LSYKNLEHATDAFIEVKASTLEEAFMIAGQSVVETTLDISAVEEKEQKIISTSAKNLRNLLLNWLEQVNYSLITEGFAIHRISLKIQKEKEYKITATLFGEPIDLQKHNFKIEIKAPTYHLMEINQNGQVVMRFLLDL